MARFAKSLVAIAAAHSLVGALFLGSIASGRAAPAAAPLCMAAHISGGGDSAPVPISRDLSCLVSGCCACAASAPASTVSVVVLERVPVRISWQAAFNRWLLAAQSGIPSARAPPSRV
jgi:hypothetical protein